jgi:hypothetical protein
MAAEAKFGTVLNQVNINTEGADLANKEAEGILRGDTNVLDIGGIVNAATKGAVAYGQAKQTSDANAAKADYVSLITSDRYLKAEDTGKAEMFENQFQRMTENSDTYQSAFKGYSASSYARAFEGREEKVLYAKYNSFGSDHEAYINNPDNVPKTPEEYIDYRASLDPTLDKVVLGRALLADSYAQMSNIISEVTTDEGLLKARQDLGDIKSKYNTPMFLQTKSKTGAPYIANLETKLNATIAAKEKELLLKHQQVVADTISGYESNNIIGTSPMLISKDLDAAYPNPISRAKKEREMEKSYSEQVITVNYLNNNTPLDRKGPIPDVKRTKDAWQEEVTSTIVMALYREDYDTATNAALNNPEFVEEAGNHIKVEYNNAKNMKELDVVMNRINAMSAKKGGATALRSMLKDDVYVEMITTYGLAQAIYGGDLDKARDYYRQQAQSPIANAFSKDLKTTMFNNQKSLGPMFSQYTATMTAINNIDPRIAAQKESEVRKFYINQRDEYSFGPFKDKVQENTSMAPDNFQNALEPDATKEKFFTNVVEVVEGAIPHGTRNLPGGFLQTVDEYGGQGTLYNTNVIIEEENLRIKNEPKESSTWTNILEELSTGITKQTTKTIEGLSKLFDTEEAGNNINNNTLTDEEKIGLEYQKSKNRILKKAYDTYLALPKDIQDKLQTAEEITTDDIIDYGMGETVQGGKDKVIQTYITDEYGNLLPEGYVRKMGKYFKIND